MRAAGTAIASAIVVSLRRVGEQLAALDPSGGWLGPAEAQRLAGITSATRRAQFLAGRHLARACLAAQAGGRWSDYLLSAPDDAAPRVLRAPLGVAPDSLHFSLSHGGDWLACAVSTQPVGIDVERSDRPRDFAALGDWIHEGPALHDWQALPDAERQARFYEQWTLKEAWLKQLPAGARPALREQAFVPAESGANALTGSGDGLTLAVFPANSELLRLDGEALQALRWRGWRAL